MRTFLWWLFVAAVCTPMVLIAFIAAEARYSGLDPVTLRNPSAVREIVGEIAMTWVGFGKDSAAKLDRVLRLAPENSEAWTRLCSDQSDTHSDQAVASCTKAIALNPAELNYNNLGLIQERRGDACTAEESFTSANSRVNAAYPFILRNIGRAAYACGHVPSAVASFEIAETKDAQEVAVGAAEHKDEEDQQDDKDDLQTDRDWLILTYAQNKQPKLATQMCSTAHRAGRLATAPPPMALCLPSNARITRNHSDPRTMRLVPGDPQRHPIFVRQPPGHTGGVVRHADAAVGSEEDGRRRGRQGGRRGSRWPPTQRLAGTRQLEPCPPPTCPGRAS